MSLSTENQAVVLPHKGRGIASFIIGVTCIIITLLLLIGIAMSGPELPRPMIIALEVLPSGVLCAALIGIALGFVSARDRSSRKLYPLLGLTLKHDDRTRPHVEADFFSRGGMIHLGEDREAGRPLLFHRNFKSGEGLSHRIPARLGDQAFISRMCGGRSRV